MEKTIRTGEPLSLEKSDVVKLYAYLFRLKMTVNGFDKMLKIIHKELHEEEDID